MEFSFLPAAPLNTLVMLCSVSANGSPPDALPPKVLSGAPAGRTLEMSTLGTLPLYSRRTYSSRAVAQPSLESRTTTVESVSWNSSATSGSLAMC